MNNKSRYLLGSMIFLISTLVSSNEYIPPPTGPYQSSVVINTIEQNSAEEHHVYKFPQADLIQSHDTVLPPSSNRGFPVDSMNGNPGSYYRPETKSQTPSLFQERAGGAKPAAEPYYDPSFYNNPWAQNPAPRQQEYQGQWNNPGGAYDYYQYPDYSSRYSTMRPPYSTAPSPWSMMPSTPFSGR